MILRLCLLLVLTCVGLIGAEGVAPSQIEYGGGDIQIPLRVSTAQETWGRLLVFDGCKSLSVNQDWNPADLDATKSGNTLYLRLKNPSFTTSMFVLGDNGVSYSLFVFPTDRAEPLPGEVHVVLPQGRSGSADDGLPEPTDSQVVRLMKHVFGYKVNQGVKESPDWDQDALKEGIQRVGRRVIENDTFVIRSIRIYRYKNTIGYMTAVEYRGDKPEVFFNFQEIVVPNLVAVMPRTFDFIDPKYPGIMIRKGELRVVYYFCETKE